MGEGAPDVCKNLTHAADGGEGGERRRRGVGGGLQRVSGEEGSSTETRGQREHYAFR